MPETKLTFTREKETKNTVRYKEETTGDERPTVGTLYLLKNAAGEAQTLNVTITPA